MKIIGIDFATQPNKTGLALAEWDGTDCKFLEATAGSRTLHPVDITSHWLDDQPTLIAIDAPLGWPTHLGNGLSIHRAGEAIALTPNHFFSRETDRFVYNNIGKKPLDVGAARIARTAHAALKFIGDLRNTTKSEIPLAWDPKIQQTSVIEVYPAATLIAHQIRSSGYKEKSQVTERKEIIDKLKKQLILLEISTLEVNADVLDAVVCILAGVDFLNSNVFFPDDHEVAKKEGWIWVSSGS